MYESLETAEGIVCLQDEIDDMKDDMNDMEISEQLHKSFHEINRWNNL